MDLTSRERARLRGLANGIATIVTVGKDGIGEGLIRQTSDALEARELVKGRVLDNSLQYDAAAAAQALAAATSSAVVQVIGSRFVLYRPRTARPREKRAVPARRGKKKGEAR